MRRIELTDVEYGDRWNSPRDFRNHEAVLRPWGYEVTPVEQSPRFQES